METVFRQSYLKGTSNRLNDVKQLEGKYDLFICASSWDGRCVCVTDSKISVDYAIPIFFSVRDNMGLRDKYDKLILKYCKRIAARTIPISGASINVEMMWNDLHKNILTIMESVHRPLDIIIDISTLPRYYYGAICALGIKTGFAHKITCFYAEANYPPPNQAEQEIAFTGGSWRAIPIPGLLGDYDPRKKRFYLVSIGFEGWKTLRVVSRADPERVSILFPDPGFDMEYPDRTLNNNQELIWQYKVPDTQVVKAHAGDAIGAWKALSINSVERAEEENTYYLCSGTKPHSLAMILRAMALKYPVVLYNRPDEHNVVLIEPNGKYWKYEIKDLTVCRYE